jgi:hypothetical protein
MLVGPMAGNGVNSLALAKIESALGPPNVDDGPLGGLPG